MQFAKLPFKQSAPVDQVVATCNILKKNVQGMSIRDAAIATWAAGKLGRYVVVVILVGGCVCVCVLEREVGGGTDV